MKAKASNSHLSQSISVQLTQSSQAHAEFQKLYVRGPVFIFLSDSENRDIHLKYTV